AELQHVKPHGILYNMMEKSENLADAAGEAVMASGKTTLILMAAAGSKYERVCRKMGARVAAEGFADRAYNVDLTLVSRKIAGSLITDPQKAAAQAVRMATEGKVVTMDGVTVDMTVHTICCHGDTPGAERIVRTVREALDKAGCQVKSLRDWLPAACPGSPTSCSRGRSTSSGTPRPPGSRREGLKKLRGDGRRTAGRAGSQALLELSQQKRPFDRLGQDDVGTGLSSPAGVRLAVAGHDDHVGPR